MKIPYRKAVTATILKRCKVDALPNWTNLKRIRGLGLESHLPATFRPQKETGMSHFSLKAAIWPPGYENGFDLSNFDVALLSGICK